MEKFWYTVSRNVSGLQGREWTETVVAENLTEADKVIGKKFPNHLIYLEGYSKTDCEVC